MNESQMQIIPFAFDERLVRAAIRNAGELWFVAKDVCAVLGIDSSNISRQGFLDEDEKGLYTVQTLGGEQALLTISESGLYALIFRSRKPEAKLFSKWVRAEVLPSLRKTGSYGLSGTAPYVADKGTRFVAGTLPPDLESLEEALCLPSNTRRHLWGQALQTARLEGAGIDVALTWFRFLCRMTSERKPQTDTWQRTEDFMNECLETVRGRKTSCAAVYAAYQVWWHRNRLGDLPSQRFMSSVLQSKFKTFKSSSMQLKNCVLKDFKSL